MPLIFYLITFYSGSVRTPQLVCLHKSHLVQRCCLPNKHLCCRLALAGYTHKHTLSHSNIYTLLCLPWKMIFLCVFSQCAIKCRSVSEVSVVNGGCRTPPPPHSWEETPPIEGTEAECAELNKAEAKGFVSGSPPSSSPRVPGNQVGLLEPPCRTPKTQRLLYSSVSWSAETAVHVRSGGSFHAELFMGLRKVACSARMALARWCFC